MIHLPNLLFRMIGWIFSFRLIHPDRVVGSVGVVIRALRIGPALAQGVGYDGAEGEDHPLPLVSASFPANEDHSEASGQSGEGYPEFPARDFADQIFFFSCLVFCLPLKGATVDLFQPISGDVVVSPA